MRIYFSIFFIVFICSDSYAMQKNLSPVEKFRLAKLLKPSVAIEMQKFENASYYWGGFATFSIIGLLGTKLGYLPNDSNDLPVFTLIVVGAAIVSFGHKIIAKRRYQQLIEYADAHIAYQNNIDDPIGNNPGHELLSNKSTEFAS